MMRRGMRNCLTQNRAAPISKKMANTGGGLSCAGRATLTYKRTAVTSVTRPGPPQFSMKLAKFECSLYSPASTFHRHRMPYQPADVPPSASPTQDHHVRIVQGARLPSGDRQQPAPVRPDHEGPIRPDMDLVDRADDLRCEVPEQRF